MRLEGTVQYGAPVATTFFCVAIHPQVEECDTTLEITSGRGARFNYADDKKLVGLPDEHVWPAVHAFRTYTKALEARFDNVDARIYSADMEAARSSTCRSDRHGMFAGLHMRGKAEELHEVVDASLSKFLSAKPNNRYATAVREAWGRLQHWGTDGHLSDADAHVIEREAEAASGWQKELRAFLDHANSSRLQNEVDTLPVSCRERILFGQLNAASDMQMVAIPTARTVMTLHELRETPSAISVFTIWVSLYAGRWMTSSSGQCHGNNTVPMDDLKDMLPDAELSLPAFNVVTGSYDHGPMEPTLLEIKTMPYMSKYNAVPPATAVDRFERSAPLGDIHRGLAMRDAACHNTEPGQNGPL
eukprot:jgi/Tetstr1/435078/TSEL_024047.t1